MHVELAVRRCLQWWRH